MVVIVGVSGCCDCDDVSTRVVDIKSIVDEDSVVEKLGVVEVTFSLGVFVVITFNSGNSVVKLVVPSSKSMDFFSVIGDVLSAVVKSVIVCSMVVNIGSDVVKGLVMLNSLFVVLRDSKSVVVSVSKFLSVAFGICVDVFGTE